MEADNWEGVVDNYVDQRPAAEHIRTLATEIDDLRAARDEVDLRQFLLRTVGVDCLPDPLTYVEWSGRIAHRLRQHADGIERNAASQSETNRK